MLFKYPWNGRSFVSYDDSSVQQAATLEKKVKKLEANEEFYLGLKKRLEAENKELVAQEEDTAEERDDIANSLSESMAESQNLREKIGQLEEQLSEAKDDLVRAQKVEPVVTPKVTETPVEEVEDLKGKIVSWSKSNTTLVFRDANC